MKIALIGASGYVGSQILTELLSRHHQVSAFVRSPEKLSPQPALSIQKLDIFEEKELAQALAGHDVVISSFNTFNDGLPERFAASLQVKGTESLLSATKSAGIHRVLMVGGAGVLEIAPHKQLVDTAQFPKEYKNMALAMREVLGVLSKEHQLDWVFVAPSALLVPGERTGQFRLGLNQLLVNEKGESKISTQDFAVAMVNELEEPKHHQQRFTVGY